MLYCEMDMPVKVCHVTSVHPRYDGRIFLKECTSLAKAGYDVTLLAADGGERETKNGVKIVPVPKSPLSRVKRVLTSGKRMRSAAFEIDADIYHLHDPELLPLAKKLKKAGKKVIFDSHENYPAQIACKPYLPGPLALLISRFYKSYETSVLRKIDAVIVPSTERGGKNIFKGRSKKTVYISTAPLLKDFYEKYDGEAEKKGNSVCHVGGLTYERGITHLIKAAHKAGLKLILAGKFGPEGYHESLKAMPEYECVDYRGFLSKDEVAELYKESLIGAATLLSIGQYNMGDNFATKVYEYMSMGLPVIVSRYPYSEAVLKRYEFGIAVDPEDINEIADAMRRIIDNPDEARRMGENGRRAVIAEFNWGIEEKKLLKLYGELSREITAG